jgi:hypothetical protein
VNDKIVWQTWNAGTRGEKKPGFSELRELRREKPIDLLAPLAPPHPKIVDDGVQTPHEPTVEKRWYQRRGIQASIVVGVLAAIVASYYIYNAATDSTVTWSGDVTPAMPESRR